MGTAGTSSPPHVTPDVGEFGAMKPQTLMTCVFSLGLGFNLVSFVVFIVALVAGVTNAVGHNALSGIMIAAWFTANVVRRVTPFLWTMQGRLTYKRVSAVTSVHVPTTLQGYATVFGLAADMIMLPLVLAFGAFHRVLFFSILGVFFYPPRTNSAVALILPFVFWPLARIACVGVFVWYARESFLVLDFSKSVDRTLKIWLTAATALAVPFLTWATAVLPCGDGNVLKFNGGVRCGGGGHSALTVFAMAFLSMGGALSEMMVDYLANLREVSAIPLHEEPRNDAFFLELQLMLRVLVVVVASLSTHSGTYFIVAIPCGALTVWLLLGKSRYVPSSVAVLTDLYVALLLLVTVSSALLAFIGCVGLVNWLGCVLFLLAWLLSLAGCTVMLARKHGTKLFATDTTDVVMHGDV